MIPKFSQNFYVYEIILPFFTTDERFFKKLSNKLFINDGFAKNRKPVNNFRIGKFNNNGFEKTGKPANNFRVGKL